MFSYLGTQGKLASASLRGLYSSSELRYPLSAHLPFIPLGWIGLDTVTSGTTRGEGHQRCQDLLCALRWGPEEYELQVGEGRVD